VILTIENLAKSYGLKTLFSAVSLTVDAGDKIGIVGVNGTGKSTFLKTVAGLLPSDEGSITTMRGLRLEYLAQDKEVAPDNTVLMEALRGTSPLMEALRGYEMTLAEAMQHPTDSVTAKRLAGFSARIDALDGWQLESRAKMVLTQLGLADFSARAGSLSGGGKKRLALAAALIQPVDLLLLDEPTNHLDSETITWLEEYLARQKSALLMVTHDRYFLDHTAGRILELDRGKTYLYPGNYSSFLEQKAARMERDEAGERKRQSFLRRELAWMRRGAQARSTKQRARIERYEAACSQNVDLSRGRVEIGLAGSRLGRTVIELENVSYAAGGRELVHDFSYTVQRRDRVAILGANGVGKTTLLNLVAGRLTPSAGEVTIGQTVKIGYFTQEPVPLDERLRAIEYIQEDAHYITLADGSRISAAQLMERFLFPADLQWVPVANLSGGEKRRLYLLRILMSEPNVLLLDEPTNDLDLETMAVLESFMDDFAGAILFVSHDRFFVDRLAAKVFAPDGSGGWQMHTGGWSVWQAGQLHGAETEKAAAKIKPAAEKAPAAEKTAVKKLRFTFREQREYAEIEGVIASKEGELRVVQQQMAANAADYTRLGELTQEESRLTQELEQLMERWTYLEGIAETMQ
jgi:ABC transport system ATP-binding/permease protein